MGARQAHGGRAAFIAVGKDAPPAPRADLTAIRPDVFRNRDRKTVKVVMKFKGDYSAIVRK